MSNDWQLDQHNAALLAQVDANRLHAAINPNLTHRQRKRLERVADEMFAHVMASLPPLNADILAMSDDDLLAALGVQP